MRTDKKILSVSTNIAYGLAGLAQYLFISLLAAPSIWLGLLMLGSGYYHYDMKPQNRKWDFLGMYGAILSSACFGIWGASFITWVLPVVLTFLIYILARSSRTVLGILIGILLVVIAVQAHIIYAVLLLAFAALPMTFNMLGDNALKHQYEPLHGVGWHLPTAGALMAGNIVLALAHLNILPLV